MQCIFSAVVVGSAAALAGPKEAISHSHPQANQEIFIALL